ncbi:methyltransferase domain-containing protein [Paenibacillus sp. 1011MAR3C5]|uniref:methyltransferase domain-containing protein n=1 Tax=Paenibacillus sp. 1011MAR3C5 TaxID=1675787 RepID=UPI000E6BA786|nr:methyltransferase domain-containing protein [Paenibacillus sp. 1011MAR3C5]RJE87797.1 methyltransferase domain-containing protein [Paenibacillus sp. 1011MAR3C5]
MLKALQNRELKPEYMDDTTQGGPELQEALVHLRRLNRLFGAASPTLYGVKRLWKAAGSPKELSILDIGAGSGDVNRKLLQWALEEGVRLNVTLVDTTKEAVKEASLYYWNESRVRVCQGDLFELETDSADVVTGTQFLHHFTGDELEQAVRQMMKASRIGVVINDIHRHSVPWTAVWLATRLISRNPYIRHDGPLSVAKGFRGEDWGKLRKALSLAPSDFKYVWRPLFRYSVMIRKAGDTHQARW